MRALRAVCAAASIAMFVFAARTVQARTSQSVALPTVDAVTPAPESLPNTGETAAPRSGAEQLQEIARVRASTPYCKAAAGYAAEAISLLSSNDVVVTRTVQDFRVMRPDQNELARERAVKLLGQDFVALKASATEGNQAMARLRELIKDQAPDEHQKAAMTSFEEALDGALTRQKRLGDVIARMTVVLDNHPPIDEFQQNENEMRAIESQNVMGAYKDPQGPLAHLPDSLQKTAARDADDLEYRATPVARDEQTAADRMDSAFGSC